MPEKLSRRFIKAKETKSLWKEASEKLKIDLERIFGAKVNIELVETKFAEIYLVNGKPLLAEAGENIFPTLVFKEFFALAPKVVVDMGAVPYICNGANVMAPGIVRFEGDFKKGGLVSVVDEKHGKPIAVGEIIYNGDAAKKVKHGVVVRNIHFVGDKVWNLVKKL